MDFCRRRPIDARGCLRRDFGCSLTLAIHQEWRRLIVTHSVSGVRVHDARLVAAMRVFGVKRILTFNERDFARYSDIEAIHPSSISAMNP